MSPPCRYCSVSLSSCLAQVISVGHKENVTLQQARVLFKALPRPCDVLTGSPQLLSRRPAHICWPFSQVRTYTEMESHEEKLHKMIIQSKINDTKDHMKRRARTSLLPSHSFVDCLFNFFVLRLTSPTNALSPDQAVEIEKTKVETKSARAFGNNPMSAVSSSGFGGGGGGGNFFDDDKGPAARDSYSSGPRAPVAVRALNPSDPAPLSCDPYRLPEEGKECIGVTVPLDACKLLTCGSAPLALAEQDEGFSRSGRAEAPKASVPMKGMVLGKGCADNLSPRPRPCQRPRVTSLPLWLQLTPAPQRALLTFI